MRFPRTGVGAVFLVLLAALTWWATASVTPPSPVGADAPAEEFSADRAFTHVQSISTELHVAGSPGADRVRQHIVDSLESLGLQPEIHDSVGATGNLGGFAMARVQNVVATIPGSASTGTVFLMAHYDAVQVSFGANDDGAGTSTLLETARALLAGPQPRNDIVLVFTDAEEACLCGAEAFLTDNPLAADGGVILNFEARGTSGPAIMFETTRDNADLIGVYADAVPYPVATSFAVEVYRILPNDTDFSPFRDSGTFTGLNTAYIDGSAAYHSPQDNAETISLDSLQHHGSNALALAHAFGDADIAVLQQRSASGDATYFPVLGSLVSYPGRLVWPLAALALLVVAGAMVLAVRRGWLSGGRLAGATGLALIPLVGAPALAMGLWWLLTVIRPGYGNLADPWSPGWYRIAVVALVLTVVLTWFATLRRRFDPIGLALGALAWVAILGVALAAFTPGGSYLASIPALAGGLAALVSVTTGRPMVRALVDLVAAAVALLVLAPTVQLFFPALGLELAAAPALFATLAALVLLPVLDLLLPDVAEAPRRLPAMVPALVTTVVTVAATLIGLNVDRFDDRHPVPVEMMYALDTTSGQAWWVRPGEDPTGWSDTMVGTEQDLSPFFPLLPTDTTIGAAPIAPLQAPEVEVVSDESAVNGNRRVDLLITPQRQSRLVHVQVPDATVVSATAHGREVPVREGAGFTLLFHAVPDEGLDLSLELSGSDGPVKIRVMDGSDDLATLPGFVHRPDGVGVEGSHTSEMVLVAADRWI